MSNDTTRLTSGEKHTLFRWFLNGGASLNYERFMGLSYTYSMLPTLKEIYKDDPQGLKASVLSNLQYYNCSPYLNPYIMGVHIGIEKSEKGSSLEAVRAIKTGLMGPLSGLGDSMFVTIPWTICGAIAANMALEGSIAGIIIWIAVSLILKFTGIPLFIAGITSGTSLVSQLETKIKSITECVGVLGLMVVGALITTVVHANMALTFSQGDLTMTGNEILDSIMPGIIPALTVGIVYWLLGKKVKPSIVIVMILVISVLLSVLGILA